MTNLTQARPEVDALTIPTARAERDALASRVDVLDRVKRLALLPDGVHATTEQVLAFYEVKRPPVAMLLTRHRAELTGDGYRVLRGAEMASHKMLLAPFVSDKATQVALWPRRAVLRVGMLLRDSEVARTVRTYLLDAESHARATVVHSPAPLDLGSPDAVAAILAAGQEALERWRAAEDRLIEQAPMVELACAHAAGVGDVTRQEFARKVCSWARSKGISLLQAQVFVMLSRDLGLFTVEGRSDSGQATAKAEKAGHARTRYGTSNGHNWATGVLTPRGADYAWDRIVRQLAPTPFLLESAR